MQGYWEFLVTVTKKLIEFTSEKFPGVAEMACNTLLKLAKNLKSEYVKVHDKKSNSLYENKFGA